MDFDDDYQDHFQESWTDEQRRAFATGDYLLGWRNAAIRFVVSLVIIAVVVLTVWQKIYDWFIE